MCGKFWKQVNGIWLPLDRNLGFHTLRWIVNGQYESGEIAIIKKTLSKEDKVLEIGSGLGFVTSFCSLIAGSDQVITYEANPSNAESAMRVFDKNQVSPEIRIALLGETNGVVLFPVNRTKRLASTILDPTEEVVEIAVESLNGLICQWKPTFLIMDIEGAEYDIFRIIQPLTIKKIQFELHPEILGESKCSEIFKQLDIMGFHKDEKISQHPNYYFSIHDES
jgi:FkbM family methyltransferase